jgi:hypothetical protein
VSVATKLGLFAAGLLAVFGIGAGIGTTLGPEPPDDRAPVTVVEHPPAHDGAHS